MGTTERTEPRRGGINPFANGAKIECTPHHEFIISKQTQFANLGKVSVILSRPLGEKVFDDTLGSDRAYTIDALGNTYRGNLREFLRFRYYQVEVEIKNYNPPRDKPVQKLNAWIEGREPIITVDLGTHYDGSAVALFGKPIADAERTWEEFVLPNRKEVLQALRIDVK
jgi:hypothetical protein